MRFRFSILAVVLVCLMLTSGGVASAQSNPVSSYDLNQNNRIDRDELLSVIRAHLFGGTATRGDVLQAIRYHLFDTPIQPETPSQSFGDGTWIVAPILPLDFM